MSLKSLQLASSYASSSSNLVRDFLEPGLTQSARYDRAAGYFNSSLFILSPAAWSDFFLTGGKMRLLTSVEFSPQDARALEGAGQSESTLRDEFKRSFEMLVTSDHKDVTGRLLRALVSSGALELRVAAFRKPRGLFHDKLGIMVDNEGCSVSFTGSANETWSAWSGLGNHESFDVFRSWLGEDSDRVTEHAARFESYWEGTAPGLEVFGGDELEDVIISSGPAESLVDVLPEVRAEIAKAIPDLLRKHNVPYIQEVALRDYQEVAVKNWLEGGRRGLVCFATGGGKTVTALEISRLMGLDGIPSLVVVPSGILVSQWITEIARILPHARILRADSKAPTDWRKSVRPFLKQYGGGPPQIVVTTYKTVSGKRFQSLIEGLTNYVFIGDEAHRFGAKNTRTIAQSLSPAARLGLSATPVRKHDDEGSEAVESFFGSLVEPVYTLRQAISDKNLVPYRFSFQTAPLDDEEQKEWDRLSKKISQLLASKDLTAESEATLDSLRIARAKIAKTATSKIELSAEILRANFVDGDRWLVYCETLDHLTLVEKAIRAKLPNVAVMTYVSTNEEEHRAVLSHFEGRGGVLLAIRCLDEGVDIPLINKAVIVSSSQSPREFIQRRGRILRKSPGKHLSELFDFLMTNQDGGVLHKPELDRLIDFAQDALNQEPHVRLERIRSSGLGG